MATKWTCSFPGVWDSKDGVWRIERDGEYGGWGTRAQVRWRIKRWRPDRREWETSGFGGSRPSLASAKARVEEIKADMARFEADRT